MLHYCADDTHSDSPSPVCDATGLYARIAKQLKIDPSFVSRVAHGHRKHERISKALEVELRKVLAAAQKSIRKSPKR